MYDEDETPETYPLDQIDYDEDFTPFWDDVYEQYYSGEQ